MKKIMLILVLLISIMSFSNVDISGTTEIFYNFRPSSGLSSDVGLWLDRVGLTAQSDDYYARFYLTNQDKGGSIGPNQFYFDQLYGIYSIKDLDIFFGRKRYRDFTFQLGNYSLSEEMKHGGDTFVSIQKDLGMGLNTKYGTFYTVTNPSSPLIASFLFNGEYKDIKSSLYLENIKKNDEDKIQGKISTRNRVKFGDIQISNAFGYNLYNKTTKEGTITSVLFSGRINFMDFGFILETDITDMKNPVYLGEIEYKNDNSLKAVANIIYKSGDTNKDGFLDELDKHWKTAYWVEYDITNNINLQAKLTFENKNAEDKEPMIQVKFKWSF